MMFHCPLPALLLAALLSPPCVALGAPPEAVRGYTIMEGGLGRKPKSPKEMWPNTVKAHLAFIEAARINLVVVEVPRGVNKANPKRAATARLVGRLRKLGVEVWMIYPHVLAQTFDLPRQVDRKGKRVEWNCCCRHPKVQGWLIDNGRAIAEAYRPDGLVLFGTFHVGSRCTCPLCAKARRKAYARNQEAFFRNLRAAVAKVSPKTRIGTCHFWTEPTKKTLAAVDLYCPVVSIFRPGYQGPGRVKQALTGLGSRYRNIRVVPYIKIFLASQTRSTTADILTAAKEATRLGQGFFYWGYNPDHSHAGQTYDHPRIRRELAALAPRRKRRGR